MTTPRRVLPACTQLVTRRTIDRKFLLRPSEEVNQILRYLIALYAVRHKVSLHAYSALSNHLHILKTDPEAEMPAFMRDLNAQTTRRVNSLHGRSGPLWDATKYGNVEVHGEESAWEKLVYVMTNPVKHRLVKTPEEWPGIVSLLSDLRAGKLVVERPDLPCFAKSTLPKRVEVQLTAPPALQHLSREDYLQELDRRVRERVAKLMQDHPTVLGAKAVLATKPEEAPTTVAERKKVDPISCLDGRRKQLLAELKAWRSAYREARRSWNEDPLTKFPHGTWAMRVFYNARVSSPRADL